MTPYLRATGEDDVDAPSWQCAPSRRCWDTPQSISQVEAWTGRSPFRRTSTPVDQGVLLETGEGVALSNSPSLPLSWSFVSANSPELEPQKPTAWYHVRGRDSILDVTPTR